MENILISVIIPVYNVSEYLPQCLDSVLQQDYENLEIICVEDCSTDSSREILEIYKKRFSHIKIIQNKQNIGLGLTRNEGLKVATGEYIHFLDSDDWLERDSYSRLIKKIKNLEFMPEILFFNHRIFDNIQQKFLPVKFCNKVVYDQILNPSNNEQAFWGWDRYAWKKLHKRSFLLENNILYNNYPTMEDVEQAALVYTNCKSLCYVNENIVNYRINRVNSLVSLAGNNIKYIIKSFEHNKKLYEQKPAMIKNILLGFDYYLLQTSIIDAFLSNKISLLEFLIFLAKYNTLDKLDYVCQDLPHYQKNLLINPLKIFAKKIFPKFYQEIILYKKQLLNNIKRLR